MDVLQSSINSCNPVGDVLENLKNERTDCGPEKVDAEQKQNGVEKAHVEKALPNASFESASRSASGWKPIGNLLSSIKFLNWTTFPVFEPWNETTSCITERGESITFCCWSSIVDECGQIGCLCWTTGGGLEIHEPILRLGVVLNDNWSVMAAWVVKRCD